MTTGWNSSIIGSAKPIQSTAITTSITTIYTAPTNSTNIQAGYATAELNGLSITNTTASTAIDVNVYIVPSGGTASTSNQYLYVTINGKDGKILGGLPEVLAAGDTIQVSASATGLTIRGSVTEVQ